MKIIYNENVLLHIIIYVRRGRDDPVQWAILVAISISLTGTVGLGGDVLGYTDERISVGPKAQVEGIRGLPAPGGGHCD